MKSNWTQILVFTILALVLGFILGRVTGKPAHKRMEKRMMMKHMDGKHHDMEWNETHSKGKVFKGEDKVKVVVESLEDSDFEGDTTVTIPGGEIRISRTAGEMEVQVEVEE
jgi:hypothetical protein